jgi:hypothetical protein
MKKPAGRMSSAGFVSAHGGEGVRQIAVQSWLKMFKEFIQLYDSKHLLVSALSDVIQTCSDKSDSYW